MQNKYVGDIGDFGKYGLLRALCGVSPCDPRKKLSLGIVWYFNPDDSGVGGNRLEYLLNPARFRPCDPALFHALFWIVLTNQRDVTRIGDSDIFPRDTAFFPHPVPAQIVERRAWLNQSLADTARRELVFLDPDIGLANNLDSGDQPSRMHVYSNEVGRFASQGNSVVLYHSFNLDEKHSEQINRQAASLRHAGLENLSALRFKTVAPRAYFIIPNGRESEFASKIEAFLSGPWGHHFEQVL